ncbi:hypothetical protein [Hwanghaeella sp. LZ110]|jgi:hypothetical protein|uniref:hypothetical protein n=1 Tax=Hwanghaeella sp. LZ110 TaxID=3402810 RepID=UPI003B6818B9
MSGLAYPDYAALEHFTSTVQSTDFQKITKLDPQNCLSGLFQCGTPLPVGAAEDAVLSWLITLPDAMDPARAAAILGRMPLFAQADQGETGRLATLLREIAQYPAERLASGRRRRPRN